MLRRQRTIVALLLYMGTHTETVGLTGRIVGACRYHARPGSFAWRTAGPPSFRRNRPSIALPGAPALRAPEHDLGHSQPAVSVIR